LQDKISCVLSKDMRIVIVEDYRELAQTFATFFEMENFSVFIEENPLSVLKMAEQDYFQVFLIDVGLDSISGIELARRLRKMPKAQSSVLVAVTGLGESLRGACFTAGFDEFFTKPTDVASIIKVLKRRLVGAF
jgi:DNA-binding response OmpR family regulator